MAENAEYGVVGRRDDLERKKMKSAVEKGRLLMIYSLETCPVLTEKPYAPDQDST